jgi:hypothetical protein
LLDIVRILGCQDTAQVVDSCGAGRPYRVDQADVETIDHALGTQKHMQHGKWLGRREVFENKSDCGERWQSTRLNHKEGVSHRR